MSGSAEDPPGRPARPKRPDRLLRTSQVAGIIGTAVALVGLVIAVLAWRSPVTGSADGRSPAPTSTTPVSPTPTDTPTTDPRPSGGTTRFLTDLEPDTGAGDVQRTGAHSLVMRCAAGDSVDRFREVTYLVPPAGYRAFRATAAASGGRDTRVQVVVRVDGRVVADPVIRAGAAAPIQWAGEQVSRLALRVLCDPGAVAVTLTDPSLAQ